MENVIPRILRTDQTVLKIIMMECMETIMLTAAGLLLPLNIHPRTFSVSLNLFTSFVFIIMFVGQIVQTYETEYNSGNAQIAYNSIYYSPDLSGKWI